MKRFFTAASIIFLILYGRWAFPANAADAQQAGCPVGGTISLPQGYAVNLRSGPSASFPTIANSLTDKSGAFTVLETAKDSQDRTWFRIAPGWVIGSYWQIVCPSSGAATSTPTRTATVAPRTPTRIASSTPGPTATEIPILLTAIADESYVVIPFYCPSACEGWIIVRGLP